MKGLYAAGEVACGLHGANRLGGNSLSDILVFGRRAGMGASDYVKTALPRPVTDEEVSQGDTRIMAPFKVTNGSQPLRPEGEARIGRCGATSASVRNEADLKKGLDEIRKLRLDARNCQAKGLQGLQPVMDRQPPGLEHAPRLRGDNHIGARAEGEQGAHTRVRTIPQKDDEHWMVNIITRLKDGQMSHELVRRPEDAPRAGGPDQGVSGEHRMSAEMAAKSDERGEAQRQGDLAQGLQGRGERPVQGQVRTVHRPLQ